MFSSSIVVCPTKASELGRLLRYAARGSKLVALITHEWADRFREGIDYDLLKGRDLQGFKDASTPDVVGPNTSQLIILYTSGIDLVLLNTEKPVGNELRRWLVDDVFPSLRKTGQYRLTPERILENTKRPIQIQHTKDVAVLLYPQGKAAIVKWMTASFVGVKGMYPKTYVKHAYIQGDITNKNLSGREALRRREPPKACVISLMDQLGFEFQADDITAIEVAKQFEPGFQAILDAGLKPAELGPSPLER